MLGKRKSSRPIAPVKKRRKVQPAIEEITFDFDAREEYLTGFHKRKLQRIKHAKEEALKREREEKVAARKALRDDRRVDREKHVEAVNAAVRNAEGLHEGDASSDDHSAQWEGIEDSKDVDHEDDYLDDDRHTVVTVEAVHVSHDGLQRSHDDPRSEDDGAQAGGRKMEKGRNTDGKTVKGSRTRNTKPSTDPDSRPRKKKKFRYESRAERKVTRFKERSGGKAKAKARRE
ncbi:MAG: hypothetical protein LQ348_002082 [Seirophora lacunosa]|nr:MAG: hypothetical protein LQ348_002082 [Seirophora lacunosa]